MIATKRLTRIFVLLLLAGAGCGDSPVDGGRVADGQPTASEPPAPVASKAPPARPPKPDTSHRPPKVPSGSKKPPKTVNPEAQAAAALEKLGAYVVADSNDEHILEVRLANNKNARQAAEYLAKLPHLRLLSLSKTRITDADLLYLFDLAQLESLNLRETKITNAGLAYLSNMQRLRYLNLTGTHIDDRGLVFLYGLKSLKTLYLRGTDATRRGGKKLLDKLPNLSIK